MTDAGVTLRDLVVKALGIARKTHRVLSRAPERIELA